MKIGKILLGIPAALRRAAPVLAVLAVALAVSAPPADAASTLDQYRASGAIGERYDGYVVVRQNSGAASQLAAQVNAQRRDVYAKRAKQQRVSIDQVGSVYARQIYASAPKGTWFLTAGGKWVRK